MQESVLIEKRHQQKVTPRGEPSCQVLVSSTCSLSLGMAPEGGELTMETVMAVCSGSQENEKHIETCSVSMGRGTVGPMVVKPA